MVAWENLAQVTNLIFKSEYCFFKSLFIYEHEKLNVLIK